MTEFIKGLISKFQYDYGVYSKELLLLPTISIVSRYGKYSLTVEWLKFYFEISFERK
jgi:hypothetical protein